MTLEHPEILLVVGLVGLYLYDSTILLLSNEGILNPVSGSRWAVLFGSERFQIRGKEPFMPNPLLPHRPLFRLSWPTEGLVVGPIQQWSPPTNIYYPLAPMIWGMAIALFCLIPLGLFSRLGILAVVAGIALFYASTLSALAWVWMKRSQYQCSNKRFVALAFESLTCPPFALNLIRHLSAEVYVPEDLLSASRRFLSEEDWSNALGRLISRVDNEIAWESEGTDRAFALNLHRRNLLEESKSCQALNF